MKIVLGLGVFRVGRAEMFTLRLCQQLTTIGHEVFFFDVYEANRDPLFCDLITAHNGKIIPTQLNNVATKILWKLNALFCKIGYTDFFNKVCRSTRKTKLKRYCRVNNISVLNSHSYAADAYFSVINLPLVITMHGDYEWKYNNFNDKKKQTVFLNKTKHILKKANFLIYVADKNLDITKYANYCPPHKKIYIGLNKPNLTILTKSTISVFNFTMIARGIETKGWEIAIKAFIQLYNNEANIQLTLVYTETEYMQWLQKKYCDYPAIVFSGYTLNALLFIANSNCVILPSFFKGESCPTTLAEAIACGIPCIATNIGEVANILEINQQNTCGYVINFDEKNIESTTTELAQKMNLMITDVDTYNTFKKNTHNAFQKFNLEKNIYDYINVFESVI